VCKKNAMLVVSSFFSQRVLRHRAAEQSVHLTLGILRKSQAFFYALAFFQLDGFAVPAPAQVTQTVGRSFAKLAKEFIPIVINLG